MKITLVGLENAHGLVVRVVNGSVEIDASKLPLYREQQERYDSKPSDYTIGESQLTPKAASGDC
jgi:hypothetical protein